MFLHEVVPGAADRSYGIGWRLAGLPGAVIERARSCSPSSKPRTAPRRAIDDLPLFAAAPHAISAPPRDNAVAAVIAALTALHPDELTPREALEALYALKLKAAAKGT